MVMDSKYRRQALQCWQAEREETLEQVKEELANAKLGLTSVRQKLKATGLLLIHPKKKHL